MFPEQLILIGALLLLISIILGKTFPIAAGVSSANMIFNIVFFITITSALLQGSTINVFAKFLGLSDSTTEE
jgi:cell volume regulation protein A